MNYYYMHIVNFQMYYNYTTKFPKDNRPQHYRNHLILSQHQTASRSCQAVYKFNLQCIHNLSITRLMVHLMIHYITKTIRGK